MATGPTCDLVPDELLLSALDYLELAELLGIMLVSKRWRMLAIDHPTYWKRLSLAPGDSNRLYRRDVPLFRTRLSRSKSRPVTVTFHLVLSESEPFAHALLEDLSQHLSHIDSLQITASADVAGQLFDALHTPAPILQAFKLFLRPSIMGFAYPAETLRHDIFDSTAPALKKVSIFNLCMPSKFAPGLAAVEELELGCSWLWTCMMTPTVLEWSPRLRTLMLTGDVIVATPSEGWEADMWESLEALVFNGTPISHAWHTLNLPIMKSRNVTVRNGDAVSIAVLADQLHGPLGVALALVPEREEVDLTMRADDGAVRRISASLTDDQEDGVLRQIANLAPRITSLSSPLQAWALVGRALSLMPHLTDIGLSISSRSENELSCASSKIERIVSCPSLRRVTLTAPSSPSESPVAVALEDIAALVSAHIVNAQLPFSLCLVNIAALGRAQDFADTFELDCPR